MSLFKDLKKFIREKQESFMTIDEILRKRYIEPERKAKEWREAFDEATETNNQERLKLLIGFSNAYWKEDILDTFLEAFSLNAENLKQPLDKKKEFINKCFGDQLIELKYDEETCCIKTKDVDIRAIRMDKLFNFKKEIIAELGSMERKHKCHEMSRVIAHLMPDEACDIVTGNAFELCDKGKYLHSWVEMELEGINFCADYTQNLLVDKESYYKIHHIDERDICRISNDVLKREDNIFRALTSVNAWYSKMYLADRETALKWYEIELQRGTITEENEVANCINE